MIIYSIITSMDIDLNKLLIDDVEDDKCVIKVRIKTSYYKRGRRYCKETQITDLTKGPCYSLSDDISNLDVESVLTRIVNLDEVDDGIYQVILINQYRDWETGCIEDYDYKLIKCD